MSYEGGDAEGNISNSWEPGILGIPNCPVVGEKMNTSSGRKMEVTLTHFL